MDFGSRPAPAAFLVSRVRTARLASCWPGGNAGFKDAGTRTAPRRRARPWLARTSSTPSSRRSPGSERCHASLAGGRCGVVAGPPGRPLPGSRSLRAAAGSSDAATRLTGQAPRGPGSCPLASAVQTRDGRRPQGFEGRRRIRGVWFAGAARLSSHYHDGAAPVTVFQPHPGAVYRKL